MGGNEHNNYTGSLDIQRALDIARNTEGDLDPRISDYLENNLSQVWRRIQANPDSCILTKDEFAVFNFFRARFHGSEMAEKTVARFWQHHQE